MSLVEEEDHPRSVLVPDLRQILEEFGQQPEQEAGIQTGLEYELVRRQDADHTPALEIGSHQVSQFEGGFSEKAFSSIILEPQEGALYGGYGGCRHQTVLGGDVLTVLGDEAQERPEVRKVQEEQPLVVGQPEDDLEDSRLGVVEFEYPGHECRAHLGCCGADGVPLPAVEVPQDDRAGLAGVTVDPDGGDPLPDPVRHLARHGQAGHVALHVRHEDRDAHAGESFGQHHEGHGLARAGRPGDKAVPVSIPCEQVDLLDSLPHEYPVHHRPPVPCSDQAGKPPDRSRSLMHIF